MVDEQSSLKFLHVANDSIENSQQQKNEKLIDVLDLQSKQVFA